jgi:hypothetical protein
MNKIVVKETPLEGIWVVTNRDALERIYIGNKLIGIKDGKFNNINNVVYETEKCVKTLTHWYIDEKKKWILDGHQIQNMEPFSFNDGRLTIKGPGYTLELKKVDDEARFNTIKNLLENEWKFETKTEYEAKECAEREERQRTPFTGIWLLQDDKPGKFETVYVKNYCIQIKDGKYDYLGRFVFTEKTIKEQYAFYYDKDDEEWSGMVFGEAEAEEYKFENDALSIGEKKYQKVNDSKRFNKIKNALEEAEDDLDDDWEGIE